MVILTFALSCIFEITTLKISNLPNDLTSDSAKNLIIKTMKNLSNKKLSVLPI